MSETITVARIDELIGGARLTTADLDLLGQWET